VKPLEETMKIYYFEAGITDPPIASIRSMIMVDHTKFKDLDTVMLQALSEGRNTDPSSP
jgi:hypothetical protein